MAQAVKRESTDVATGFAGFLACNPRINSGPVHQPAKRTGKPGLAASTQMIQLREEGFTSVIGYRSGKQIIKQFRMNWDFEFRGRLFLSEAD